MRITLGPSVVRGNIDEVISGLWSFANVLGLLTDIIGERTAAAGVTVDGLLIKDAGIPEAAVTAHEAALAILESQIADGTILARLANTEIITGLWVFSHSSGLLTDVILERVAAAGVTIDGARLRDGAFDNRVYAAVSTSALILGVTGEGDPRFVQRADGRMDWGDGTLARDTNLFRSSANNLKTDDSFNVGSQFRALRGIEWSVQETALSANANNFNRGDKIIQRFTLDAQRAITGFSSPAAGQMILVVNADDASELWLVPQSASSTAANRMISPTGTTFVVEKDEAVWLHYDGTSARWRIHSIP